MLSLLASIILLLQCKQLAKFLLLWAQKERDNQNKLNPRLEFQQLRVHGGLSCMGWWKHILVRFLNI